MPTTATLQPATPTAPPAEPTAPTPSPTAAAQITTPDAFLQALIATNFDFPSLCRTIPSATLIPLIRSPQLLAALDDLTRFSSACTGLRNVDLRQSAIDHLATIVADKSADPIEARRAASSILRASNPPREHRPPQVRPQRPGEPHEPEKPREAHEPSEPASRHGPFYPPGYPYPKTGLTDSHSSAHSSAPPHTPSQTHTPKPTRAAAARAATLDAFAALSRYEPAFIPSPSDTAQDLVASLITNFAAEGDNNFGLRCIELFLDDGATINAKPLPVGNRRATVEQLAKLPLADCQGTYRGAVIEQPIEVPVDEPVDAPGAPPGVAEARAVIRFICHPLTRSTNYHINLILSLTRSPNSRLPGCWLIAHAQTESLDSS